MVRADAGAYVSAAFRSLASRQEAHSHVQLLLAQVTYPSNHPIYHLHHNGPRRLFPGKRLTEIWLACLSKTNVVVVSTQQRIIGVRVHT